VTLPILLSVPHAGLRVPPEVAATVQLNDVDVIEDGDVGAAEIYALDDHVTGLVRADVARAFVDCNRPEDDRRLDGVVKTHTCWQVPIYTSPLPDDVVATLLARYHRPYHALLLHLARSGWFRVGIDAHTMAALGPPVGPDPGVQRPFICLSHADGTCPDPWIECLAATLEAVFRRTVTINQPFTGGHITRTHAAELPWLQLEFSRTDEVHAADKCAGLVDALNRWCEELGW
jgi:N-formylglutamate deformylase